MERRRCPRFRAPVEVLISSGPREGAGSLANVSYSGAEIEDVSLQLPVGAPVRLYLLLPSAAALEIEGTVTRHTERGFAVAYELFDAATRRSVDELAALVADRNPSAPRRSQSA